MSGFKGKYAPLLIAFIDDGDISALVDLLNNLKTANPKTNQKEQQALLEEILLLHRNLRGEETTRLQGLFLTLGLKKASLQHLQSNSWRKKVKGIQELSQMQVLDSYPHIAPYLNDTNINLRTAALTAKIILDKQAFSFLEDKNSLLTNWQQVQIHKALQKIHPEQIPNFSRWLHTENESVICFCLKMIHHYDQIINDPEAFPAIVKLLRHPAHAIQQNAIQTLSKVPSQETISLLLELFQENIKQSVKIQILEILAEMSTANQIPFFEKHLLSLDHQKDYLLQIATAKAIAGINKIGINKLKSLAQSAEAPLQKVIHHVLDQRI